MPYVVVNGIRTWVQGSGAGDTVVMLHGGFSDSRDFDGNLAALSSDHRLVAADRRGHGRTPDPDGPLSHRTMADDAAALIEHLDVGPVGLVGYSDGAVVALLAALQHPALVSRLVLISGAFDRRGWIMQPDHDTVDSMPAEMIDRYAEVSPDGRDHFGILAHKLADMAEEDLGITEDDLNRLDVRALVVSADDDLITLEHTIALYRGLPNSELAVIPGTSHDLLHDKPQAVTQLVGTFLGEDPAPTAIPIQRAGS